MAARAPTARMIFGLERQGIGWTLAIGAVILGLAVGLPLLDSAVGNDDASAAGTVFDVGLGVEITPVDDWSTQSQPGSGDAEFTRAGASLTVRAARFSGTTPEAYEQVAEALEEQDGVQVTSDPQTFTTQAGLVGIVGTFATPGGQGYLAVYTAGGVVAAVVAGGAKEVFPAVDGEIVAMISSIQIGPAP